MRIRTIFAMLAAALWAGVAYAAPISVAQAQQTAQQFVASHSAAMRAPAVGGAAALSLAHRAVNADGVADYYVFNRGADGGYIVAAADDRTLPVWGYVDHGSFVAAELPASVRWWLGEYQRELQWLRDHPSAKPRKAASGSSSVAPLLSTQWNQCKPYNNLCPSIPTGGDAPYGYRAPSGCVAVATAQVMKYYAWPTRGSGSHSYTTTVYYGDNDSRSYDTELSADFESADYAWSDMMDSYYFVGDYNTIYARDGSQAGAPATDAQCDAVARLMFDIGVALEMSYANSGSGASTGDVPAVLSYYFGYDDSMTQQYRDYYSGDWDNLLRSELDERRPLIYRGQSDEGGHAFVIDGYDSEGYFHVNWGWGGTSDGYFVSSVLDPDEQGAGGSEGGFSSWQAAIIGLQPDMSGQVLATSVSIDPASVTLGVGQTTSLNARVQPGNATNPAVTWRSSNSTVASVSADGEVTARRKGSAIITATTADGTNLSATCAVTVVQPATSLTLDFSELSIVVDEYATLTATVLPADATNPSLRWTTSNPAVAVVSTDGVVLAKAIGQTTITATTTDGSDLSATCAVSVKAKPKPEVPATLSAPELTITRAQAGQLFALPITITLPEGADFTNIQFRFTFPDGLRPIADGDGLYAYEGDGVPLKGRNPVLAFSDNFDVDTNWPDQYVAVGANITLTPITTNPCQVYTLNVAADADFVAGDRQMLIYSKYTDSANDSYTIGTVTDRVALTTIHFVDGLEGDVNGDGSVDINDINAVVNLILGRTTLYAGTADVNSDGVVNVFDLNFIIDCMLAL